MDADTHVSLGEAGDGPRLLASRLKRFSIYAVPGMAAMYRPGESVGPPGAGQSEELGPAAPAALLEHQRVAEAMRSLPEHWRIVLWHAEVMGEAPRDIGLLMGIGAIAVPALLARARAGLRAAYVRWVP